MKTPNLIGQTTKKNRLYIHTVASAYSTCEARGARGARVLGALGVLGLGVLVTVRVSNATKDVKVLSLSAKVLNLPPGGR